MTDDPIIDEVRRAGEAFLAQFDFDMKAACDDLRRRTDEARRSGRQVLSLPPKRVTAVAGSDKNAG